MKVTYQVSLDDPGPVTKRTFVRDAGAWPFPSLPSTGDFVAVDSDTTGARIQEVVYRPATAQVYLLLKVDGLRGDLEAQVAALKLMGFRETGGGGSAV
jgi:hypothetical protein